MLGGSRAGGSNGAAPAAHPTFWWYGLRLGTAQGAANSVNTMGDICASDDAGEVGTVSSQPALLGVLHAACPG